MITPFSSENAILIEMPKVGQIGQKWPKKRAKTDNFTNFAYFLKNYQVCDEFFFQIAPNEGM